MAVTGQKVSFVYVSSGELPQSADQNTVYFLPGEEGGLYVGNTLIADNSVADITDLDNRVSALEDGGIVVVIDSSQVPSGQTADYVQGASFDSATKTLTLTLGTLASNTTITGITNDITDINTAIGFCRDMKNVFPKLRVLQNLGLGYLTLGEETPRLSGGEAQRLKLASEMGKGQADSVFVFDEPTIGLHPLDVETLLDVFQTLIDSGATVIVIEHDLDVIRNADYIIDMGPGGGEAGGRIVACGSPNEIKNCAQSITARYI